MARLRPHDPQLPLAAGIPAHRGFDNASGVAVGGAGFAAKDAELAAVGEAVERWQTHDLGIDSRRRGSFKQWGWSEEAVDPQRLVLFHPEQYEQPEFPYEPLTPSTDCQWTAFRRARSGEQVWLPSQVAFLDLRPTAPPPRFAPLLSTGLATANTPGRALLRGTQEVIERDAVIGAWWRHYELRERAAADVFQRLGEPVSCVTRPNLDYRFYRILTPYAKHVCVVTLAGEDQEGFCFSVGSACRETWTEAVTKALVEAVQGRHYVRYLRDTQPPPPAMPTSFAEHAAYYSYAPEKLADTVLEGVEPIGSPPDKTVDTMGSHADALGDLHPILFRLMTPPGIAERHPGWCVVRVEIPGLQRLHGHHGLPFLGGAMWSHRSLTDWATMPPHPLA